LSLIEFKHVGKTYQMGDRGVPALQNVSLRVEEGELVSIMGPSGSGKSTAMHIMGLLDRPTEGEYRLDGILVSTLDDDALAERRNRLIGFIFQSFFLLPRLSVIKNVMLPLVYRGETSNVEMREQAMELLHNLKIAKLADRKPKALSGGEQQRVAIARALIGGPRLILADEPTGALDSKTGHVVMDILVQLNQTSRVTVIVITHDPSVGEQCQRVIHLADGEIVDV